MILGWLRRFLGIDPPLPVGPRPTGWNKTLTELSAENRSLSREEMEWGREYELVQLRSWARFPRDNEEFEAKQDKKVSFAIWWKAPYTTGGEGVLPKGTRIRVSVHPQDPEPIGGRSSRSRRRRSRSCWSPRSIAATRSTPATASGSRSPS